MKFSSSTFIKAAAVALVVAGATAAQARSNVYFSVNAAVAPGVVIGASNAPVYYGPAYTYAAPAPVYYEPAYYSPAPVVVSAPVYYGSPYYVRHHRHHRHYYRY